MSQAKLVAGVPVVVLGAYGDAPPQDEVMPVGESMTRQSEADACDINGIMARYEKTGLLPVVDREAFFADVSELGDFRTVMERVRMAEEFFASLPAKVRARFNHSPADFLDFTSREENYNEMVEMGLVEARPAGDVVPGAVESVRPDGVSPPA